MCETTRNTPSSLQPSIAMGFPFSSGAGFTFQGHPKLTVCSHRGFVCPAPAGALGCTSLVPRWQWHRQEAVGPALPPQCPSCPQGHTVCVPAWLCRAGEEDLRRSHAQAMTAQQDFPSFSRITSAHGWKNLPIPLGTATWPALPAPPV